MDLAPNPELGIQFLWAFNRFIFLNVVGLDSGTENTLCEATVFHHTEKMNSENLF